MGVSMDRMAYYEKYTHSAYNTTVRTLARRAMRDLRAANKPKADSCRMVYLENKLAAVVRENARLKRSIEAIGRIAKEECNASV